MKLVKLNACIYNNVGDDLMVETLLDRYPQYTFFYDNPWYTASNKFLLHKNFLNLHAIYQKWGRLNHFLNIITCYSHEDFFYRWIIQRVRKKCKCAVNIGGSIYMEREGESVQDRIKREEKKRDSLPLFVIGANFGPYKSPEFYTQFKTYFSACKDVCFRDKESYKLFSDISCVRWAPDVVFNHTYSEKERSSDNVLISVINFRNRKELSQYAEDYEMFIVSICEECIKLKKTPILMAFCESEGDFEAVERIQSLLKIEIREATRIVLYSDTREINELFSSAGFVLATRFHALILALKYDKPFYAISYNKKIQNVMMDIGCDSYCQPEEIRSIDSGTVLQSDKAKDILLYIDNAELQFSRFDEYMKSN